MRHNDHVLEEHGNDSKMLRRMLPHSNLEVASDLEGPPPLDISRGFAPSLEPEQL